MFLGSSCCNIAENSTFARPLDFACRLNPSFHAFAEACATETLGGNVDNIAFRIDDDLNLGGSKVLWTRHWNAKDLSTL